MQSPPAAWCFPGRWSASGIPPCSITPAATLIDSASRLALKKNETMQCSVPTGRSSGPQKLMSAVCADVPITQEKWKKSL